MLTKHEQNESNLPFQNTLYVRQCEIRNFSGGYTPAYRGGKEGEGTSKGERDRTGRRVKVKEEGRGTWQRRDAAKG
jgi:hypothetical protein